MNITEVARIAHEVDRAYCLMTGDATVVQWSDLAAQNRESAALAVRAVANFTTPEATHEAWTKELARNGWTHGETFDVQAKTHPSMVPYDDLPFTVRVRDKLVVAVVRAALGIVEPKAEEVAEPA